MQTITTKAQEESTFIITISFTDEDGDAMTPTTVKWSLMDTSGTAINSRTEVSETPATSIEIVLAGDDLQILTAEAGKKYVVRYVVIEAVYNSDAGSGLKLNEQISFVLENLKKIS